MHSACHYKFPRDGYQKLEPNLFSAVYNRSRHGINGFYKIWRCRNRTGVFNEYPIYIDLRKGFYLYGVRNKGSNGAFLCLQREPYLLSRAFNGAKNKDMK
jgi:hypothetical protein